jgi:hypothetical protein
LQASVWMRVLPALAATGRTSEERTRGKDELLRFYAGDWDGHDHVVDCFRYAELAALQLGR